jgi:hypothetical protein
MLNVFDPECHKHAVLLSVTNKPFLMNVVMLGVVILNDKQQLKLSRVQHTAVCQSYVALYFAKFEVQVNLAERHKSIVFLQLLTQVFN